MTHKLLPAVKALIQQDDKFLVIKQAIGGRTVWDLPGGKVKYAESPYDTLLREVKEEVNLSIYIGKPIGLFWFFRFDNEQIVCTVFLCSVVNKKIDLSQNPDTKENIIEYKWITKEEFLTDEYEVSHKSIKNIFEVI